MLFKSLLLLAAAVMGANAQSATSSGSTAVPSGLTTCIIDCSSQAAASAGCSSLYVGPALFEHSESHDL